MWGNTRNVFQRILKRKFYQKVRRKILDAYIENHMVSVFTGNDLDEQIDNLLRKNAPALLLSYARPLIASITNASKFPTYNIPFLDFSAETVNVTTLDRED